MRLKKIFFLFLLFSISSFAQSMCNELCQECENKADEVMCGKVEETCRCAFIRDSLQTLAEKLKEEKEESKKLFLMALASSCQTFACTQTAHFENGKFASLEKSTGLLSPELKDSLLKANASKETQAIQPLSGECNEFCKSCPFDTALFKTDSLPTFENPLCERINQNCGCYEFEKKTFFANQQAAQDSVAKIETAMKRFENEKILADSLFALCDTSTNCHIQFAFLKETYELLAPAKILDASIASKDTSTMPSLIQTKDSTAKKMDPLVKAPPPSTDEKLHINSDKKGKKLRSHYFGINALVAFPEQETNDKTAEGIETGLGFFYRYYFYRWGSLQLGANFLYRYSEMNEYRRNVGYDIDFVWYDRNSSIDFVFQDLLLEFPANIRLGFGLQNGSSLFASFTFALRKPLYEYIALSYNYRSSYKNDYGFGYFDDTYSYFYDTDEYFDGTFSPDSFEMNFYLGVGAQIMRGLSIQIQFLLDSEATGEARRFTDDFRITLDFIF